MLFLVNQAGVPSVAKFVHLSATPNDLPPNGSIDLPTGDLHADYEGDSVNFAGSATDPDNAVTSSSCDFPGRRAGFQFRAKSRFGELS